MQLAWETKSGASGGPALAESSDDEKIQVLGSTQILGHCVFEWTERIDGGARTLVVRDHHCDRCIAELRRRRGGHIVDLRTANK